MEMANQHIRAPSARTHFRCSSNTPVLVPAKPQPLFSLAVSSSASRIHVAAFAAAVAAIPKMKRMRVSLKQALQVDVDVKKARDQADADMHEIDTNTTVVATVEDARRVVEILRSKKCKKLFHAVDTEVMGWSPGLSTYQAGEVFCFSIYCGPEVDFGNGARLFIDDLDENGNRRGVLKEFKEYLEDPSIRKVFHNYSFDRAMFVREGIWVQGFVGDTMHMAMLDDSYDSHKLSYLGDLLLGEQWAKNSLTELAEEAGASASEPEKLHLSKDKSVRDAWVDYSAFDTQATWKLYETLRKRLTRKRCMGRGGGTVKTLLEYYEKVYAPYLEVVAGMQERGVPLDESRCKQELDRVSSAVQDADREFRKWVKAMYAEMRPGDHKLQDAVDNMNLRSTKQVRHVLTGFGLATIANQTLLGLHLPFADNEGNRGGNAAVSTLSFQELIKELAGSSVSSGRRGCGWAYNKVGAGGCEALDCLRRALTPTSSCPKAFIQSCLNAAVDGRFQTSFFPQQRGSVRWSKPDPKQVLRNESDYPGIASIIAPKTGHVFLTVEYVDLKLAILTHISGDSKLQKLFEGDIDVHAGIACELFPHVASEVESGNVVLGSRGIKGDDAEDEDVGKSRNCVAAVFPSEYEQTKRLNRLMGHMQVSSFWYKRLHDVGDELEPSDRSEQGEELADQWIEAFSGVKDLIVSLTARKGGTSKTLCGRTVNLERRLGRDLGPRYLGDVQEGSVNDVLMQAMVKIGCNQDLKDLGFNLIMQSYETLVLEGPAESSEEALTLVTELMRDPFLDGTSLSVPLPVQGRIRPSLREPLEL